MVMKVKELFIVSSVLSIVFLIVYSLSKGDIQFDLLSHLFGGISVAIVLSYLVTRFTRFGDNLTLMLLCGLVCLFEVGESYIFLYLWKELYPFYDIEYIITSTNILDTTSDILMGLVGGYLYLKI